ncbi:MAG: TolC family protein [Elusimicrobia bacterium]|nr:TolC family protein [Elusimicrobiota bacterium]
MQRLAPLCTMALILAGVPVAAQGDGAPVPVGLRQAVELAVSHNLAARLARYEGASARGEVLRAASSLLPRLTGSAGQSRTFRENLAAQGLTSLGPVPTLIGPFNTFDARLRLVQEVFDLPAARGAAAAAAQRRAAVLEEQLAAEQVSAAAALAYFELYRASEAIASARADEELAAGLLRLAEDRKAAGTAAGIDVARARTQWTRTRLASLEARSAAQAAALRLARVLGLEPGRGLELREQPAFAPEPAPEVEAALQEAAGRRLELRVAAERLGAARQSLAAGRESRLPSISVAGDVGLSGAKPDSSARTTGSLGAALQVPLFSGREIEGRVRRAEAERDAAEARLEDMRAEVEADVRLALLDMATAVDRVRTAQEAERLAEEELSMSRDRFAAGVADNLELLEAQTALTRARDTRIFALARYQNARVNLALGLGRMGDFGS